MPDTPLPDTADRAEDFARRYAQELDYLSGDRMTELGTATWKPERLTPWRSLRPERYNPFRRLAHA